MGFILSKFYDKPSTRATLEKIESEIQNIEERRWDKIKREQFVVQILSFIPITILIANLCILIYPSESTWRDKLLLSVPIFLFILILWASKRVVQWYSRWSLDNEEVRLRKLQKEKKRILELVCETESYRVAAELLEKYDPKQLRRRERPNTESRPSSPLNKTLTKVQASPIRTPQHQQHHAQTPFHNQSLNFSLLTQAQPHLPAPPPPTPTTKPAPKSAPQVNLTSTNLHNTSMNSIAASSVQGRPVRPILSKDRSLFEKVVDWVVADGPDNRFALICKFCYGHNGMSLAEEYETINFRCCYCYNLNTATHKRQVNDQLQPDREKEAKLTSSVTKTNTQTDPSEEHKKVSEEKKEVEVDEKVKEDDVMEDVDGKDEEGEDKRELENDETPTQEDPKEGS